VLYCTACGKDDYYCTSWQYCRDSSGKPPAAAYCCLVAPCRGRAMVVSANNNKKRALRIFLKVRVVPSTGALCSLQAEDATQIIYKSSAILSMYNCPFFKHTLFPIVN